MIKTVMRYYDANVYTAEEILNENAVPKYKYLYIYDENGNLTAQHRFTADGKEDQYITWEYDENRNMIRRTPNYGGEILAIYYNDRNLPVKEERYYVEDGEKHYRDVVNYSYDEDGNLIEQDGTWVRMEYDRIGNLIKEYEPDYLLDSERLEAQWIYEYHYSKE